MKTNGLVSAIWFLVVFDFGFFVRYRRYWELRLKGSGNDMLIKNAEAIKAFKLELFS